METRRAIGFGLAVALTVVAVWGLAKPSLGSERSGSHREVLRFRLDYEQTPVDVNEEGLTPGDYAVFSGTLFDKDGQPVGPSVGQCTFTAVKADSIQAFCNTTNVLPKGEIDTQGYLFFRTDRGGAPEPWRNAIVGGTGAYKDAHGEATSHTIDEDTDEFVFEILR